VNVINTINHIKTICIMVILLIGVCHSNDLLSQDLSNGFDDVPSLQQSEDINIKVFPNPTTDFVRVSTESKFKGSFKLNNIVGKILLEGEINKEGKNIDLMKFRTGIYIISVYDTTGKKVGTRKIIKN